MTYTVNHFYQNPRNNRTETYGNLKDAVRYGLKQMWSDEDETGISTLEGNGKYAERRWNKINAKWHR